jgi:hypothetical protein
VSYTFVEDIEYRRWGKHFVGDRLLEKVPQLAIVVNLGKDTPLPFLCDGDWEVVVVSGAETIKAVKERAEKNYPGVAPDRLALAPPSNRHSAPTMRISL